MENEIEMLKAQMQNMDGAYTSMLKIKNKEIENLHSVMVAAAEEIQQHWQAHCDEEGYGPSNLIHRLESGIASNYHGYKFGEFTRMQKQLNDLQAENKALLDIVGGGLKAFCKLMDEIEVLKKTAEKNKDGFESLKVQLSESQAEMKGYQWKIAGLQAAILATLEKAKENECKWIKHNDMEPTEKQKEWIQYRMGGDHELYWIALPELAPTFENKQTDKLKGE